MLNSCIYMHLSTLQFQLLADIIHRNAGYFKQLHNITSYVKVVTHTLENDESFAHNEHSRKVSKSDGNRH